jgi:hypothetical protein
LLNDGKYDPNRTNSKIIANPARNPKYLGSLTELNMKNEKNKRGAIVPIKYRAICFPLRTESSFPVRVNNKMKYKINATIPIALIV